MCCGSQGQDDDDYEDELPPRHSNVTMPGRRHKLGTISTSFPEDDEDSPVGGLSGRRQLSAGLYHDPHGQLQAGRPRGQGLVDLKQWNGAPTSSLSAVIMANAQGEM